VWEAIEAGISAATGERFRVLESTAVGGGCISEAVRLRGKRRSFFVKRAGAGQLPMFEAEAAGLAEIRASGALRAPEPIAWGVDEASSWLALEFVPFGRPRSRTAELLGEGLAAMHRCSAAQFGWQRDNTIGSTPQPNPWRADWVEFLSEQRLGFQLELARSRGAPAALVDRGRQLLASLPAFFADYRPSPALLHGDLWGGNWGADAEGRPVLFDPAVYYGDREADLAMTELFGGFDRRFYRAYEAAWPLDQGYPVRRTLYNLYHVLNHFNLFGGGYLRQAQAMIGELLAQN
jgi:protein-ribulosamine 3-kinase